GYWRVRTHLLMRGTMPVTSCLAEPWWATPNIHLCTIRDFVELTQEMGITIERGLAVGRSGRWRRVAGRLPNLLGEQAVFQLARG
ncbi:methionine biosynthesis protein MetW, partial [Zavarzinia sp.]|uniref:methionine biosynthesis protein MetW n=1 Tax=Zavarzinia sp. TaxID=2027920 RepID=UPI00356A2F76